MFTQHPSQSVAPAPSEHEQPTAVNSHQRKIGQDAHRWPSTRFFLIAEVIALLGTLTLVLNVTVHPGPLPGDIGLTLWWQHLVLPHQQLTAFIEEDSTLNWPRPSAVIILLIVSVLAILRRWLDLLLALATIGFADGTNFLLSQLIRRPRPGGSGIFVVQHINNIYSFPSGHVEHAIAFLGLILFFTFQVRQRSLPWLTIFLWVVRILLLAVIVLMMPSRVLEGEHWPSDGLAGLLYGSFWLLIAVQVYGWAAGRWPRLLGANEPQPNKR